MNAHGGIITEAGLKNYRPERRVPVRGTCRGYEVISMPPINSGGTALIERLDFLEGYDVGTRGCRSRPRASRKSSS